MASPYPKPPPFGQVLGRSAANQALMRWLGAQTHSLHAPKMTFTPPPQGKRSLNFNPFMRLAPAQIEDLRHNDAFLNWVVVNRAWSPFARMWFDLAKQSIRLP